MPSAWTDARVARTARERVAENVFGQVEDASRGTDGNGALALWEFVELKELFRQPTAKSETPRFYSQPGRRLLMSGDQMAMDTDCGDMETGMLTPQRYAQVATTNSCQQQSE